MFSVHSVYIYTELWNNAQMICISESAIVAESGSVAYGLSVNRDVISDFFISVTPLLFVCISLSLVKHD